jgi:hypothetical protein
LCAACALPATAPSTPAATHSSLALPSAGMCPEAACQGSATLRSVEKPCQYAPLQTAPS